MEKELDSTWNEQVTTEDKSLYEHKNFSEEERNESSSYTCSSKINSKIFLRNAHPLKVKEKNDVLVLQTHKNMFKKSSGYREGILTKCGDGILDDMQVNWNLSLSECIVTSAHNIGCLHKIMHVVLPKYSNTFQNACESSLHLAARNVIDTSINYNLRSVVLGHELFNPSKSYPQVLAITIALRTLRRCLDKLGDKFDRLTICVEDKELFDKVREHMKYYFPRNKQEELFYAKFLPDVKETEWGDIILPERNMKIHKEFESNNRNCSEADSLPFNKLEAFYSPQHDGISDYQIDDRLRIEESINNSQDFSRQFFYHNTKLLTKNLEQSFKEMKFFEFKGEDILQRKIFYVDLNRINFSEVDNDHQIIPLIIYLKKYFLDISASFRRICLVVFCKDIARCNYPTIDFVKSVNNILTSQSVTKIFEAESLQMYLDATIWSGIEFLESFEGLQSGVELALTAEDFHNVSKPPNKSIGSDI